MMGVEGLIETSGPPHLPIFRRNCIPEKGRDCRFSVWTFEVSR